MKRPTPERNTLHQRRFTRKLSRQGGAACQGVTKLLRMIEGETERLPEERNMSHLAAGTNHSLALEMEYRAGNIQ